MVAINVSYCIHLVDLLDELVSDVKVSDPEYRFAFDVGSNPIIQTLTREVGHNPAFYALPTERGVKFDLVKLAKLRETLVVKKTEAEEVASEVIAFEFDRLNATCDFTFECIGDTFHLLFHEQRWSGSAEHIISSTMNITDPIQTDDLWKKITAVKG